MSTSNQFVAFFGATGGCANACLTHTLNAGLHATALARTPSKLANMLRAQGVSQQTLDAQLRIIQGDILDVASIKRTLISINEKTGDIVVASHIISGIGASAQMKKSLTKPVVIDNPTVCATALENTVEALQQIYAEHPVVGQLHKPSITVISSTGISDGPEDVPFGLRFLYHTVLATPHKDKKNMEELALQNEATAEHPTGVFRGAIVIRASLMTGDQDIKKGKGWQKLKVGREEKPALGYTVRRSDVGQWIFEQIIKKGDGNWLGQKITLTN
ncbi:hypothetical protein BGZ99_003183 [Dissophora globulifera]|uniref:NAD(P)-binding domain-containing protein n=1 Tax=Dissophora globulifera TaxID=979702 RepID=A0A9P6RLZ1_9FUNG|nr:hypothetical protein BGZ99_003183 [Dissophora globulifera]